MADSPGGKEVGRLNLKVLPDTSEFAERLKAFAERVEEQVTIQLKVELDNDQVVRELAALQARMEAADLELEVDVDLDAAAAIARLDLTLAAMQGTASLNPINVDIDLDTLGAQARLAATTVAMQGTADSSSHVGRQIALWGPLIFIAAAGIAAIGPALAVIFPLVAGIALLVGTLFVGFDSLSKLFEPIITDFSNMEKSVGRVLTAGLGPLVQTLSSDFMPVLEDGLQVMAQLFNTALSGLLTFLTSTDGIAAMTTLFTGLGPALEPFALLLAPLVEVFVRLSTAALPALQMMGDAILRVTEDFASFLAAGGATDTITESMRLLGDIMQSLGGFTADIFPSLFAAAPAVIAFVDGMLESFGGLFQILQPLFTFMSEHLGTMGLLGAVLAVLATGIAIVTAATAAWNIVLALNPITLLIIGIAALIAGLVYAYNHFEGFRNVVNTVWLAIRTIVSVVIAAIVAYVRAGISMLSSIWSGLQALYGVAASAFGRIRTAVSNAISSVVSTVRELPGKAVSALSGIGSTLYNIGKDLIQGFINGIGDMFGKVKGKLGELTGKLTSWKGPESLDRVILFGSGQLVIDGFIRGLESQYGDVRKSLEGFTSDLETDMAPLLVGSTFDGRAAAAAIDAANSDGGAWQEIRVTNWAAGTGQMRRVADDSVAAQEQLDSTDRMMGVPA